MNSMYNNRDCDCRRNEHMEERFHSGHSHDIDCCHPGHPNDIDCCRCHHTLPGHAILRGSCATNTSISLPVATTPTTTATPLASFTLDTRCLSNPNILLQFTAQVSASPAAAALVTIPFIITKQCGISAPIQVGSGTFAQTLVAGSIFTFALDAFVCDSSCDDCCTYTISVGPGASAAAALAVTIAGTFFGLAVGSPC